MSIAGSDRIGRILGVIWVGTIPFAEVLFATAR
jgi:hypothetical protein